MLGPGWDEVAELVPALSLGPGWDSFAELIPALSLGPGWDSDVDFNTNTGIRGPQIEPYDLELDRLANITSASLAIVPDVDLTSIATTALYTASQKSYILGVLLRVTTADTVTTAAEASVGVNPSTNNVFANEELISLDAIDDLYGFWGNAGTGTILNTSDQLDLSVNTGATATTLTAVAYIIGVQL